MFQCHFVLPFIPNFYNKLAIAKVRTLSDSIVIGKNLGTMTTKSAIVTGGAHGSGKTIAGSLLKNNCTFGEKNVNYFNHLYFFY